MVSLQQHFSSMEETVRSLLQNQNTMESPSVDPLHLMKAYKDKLLEEMWKQQDSLECTQPLPTGRMPSSSEVDSNGHQEDSDQTQPILEQLRALEAENSALAMENDTQRKQYERCLDEVANQVVQALLTQKDLKEECVKLRTRVFDLEQQNRIMAVLFQQRIKTSTNPGISEEVQRNGKTGVSTGRWPSLLSLTCPRSSCSGSEASLSSGCSEYSSGSHTWAEGRGYSKQAAISREKRMSAGSVSSNHSVSADQPDLSWKQGHILKGLKRLQMRSPGPKETSSLVSTSHFKDCMTSNEGIYSLGAKCGAHGMVPKLTLVKGNPFKPGAGVSTLISDSDDADDESPQSLARDSCDPPMEDILHLEEKPVSDLRMAQEVKSSTDNNSQEEPVRLVKSSSHSPLPIKDAFVLQVPPLRPEPSPTECPMTLGGLENNTWKEKNNQSAFTKWNVSDSCNLRSEPVKQPQDKITDKELEAGASELTLPIQHAAARALSYVCEARHRSVSMDRKHCRDPKCRSGFDSKDYNRLESQQRKEKPMVCDSARKAFILRSKSADGGQDQAKLHQPLHQKLLKVNQRYKNRSNSLRPSCPQRKTHLNKPSGPANGVVQKDENFENSPDATSGSPECIVQGSSSSPQKLVKVFKPPGLNDCPKNACKVSQPASKLPSRNDCGLKGPDPSGSLLKHRRTDPHTAPPCTEPPVPPHNEIRLPSPPPPPGRTTSLLIQPGCDSSPQVYTPVAQPQTSSTAKANANSTNAQSSHSSVSQMQPQMPNKIEDTCQIAPRIAVEVKKSPKRVPGKVYLPFPASTPIQEFKETDTVLSPMGRTVAQTPPQEKSLSQSTKHLPQAKASPLCHGIVNNVQHSGTRAIMSSLPVGFKTIDTSHNLGCSLAVNIATNGMQTCDTFNQETYTRPMMHCVTAAVAKAKARRKLETRCSSLEEPALPPPVSDNGVTLDWAFDEEGWLFKRSVSVSTRPPLHPIMGMNGAKARSQSFGARYMDRPNISRSGKVRTHIKTNSGSSLNSLGDAFRGGMSGSNSYHCPLNRSHINSFMIEEGLPLPSHPGVANDRFGLSHERVNSLHPQCEKQQSGPFCKSIHGEPERMSTVSTIEEKVMMGIEENLQKSQEQEKTNETKQKSGSTLANWFGFRKSKLPALSGKKADTPKVKEEKKEPKLGSILGGKHAKSDKKKERRKSEGHRMDGSVGKRDSQDAVLLCLSMASQGAPIDSNMQGQTVICEDTKTNIHRMYLRNDKDNAVTLKSPSQDHLLGSGSKLDSGFGTFPLPDSSPFTSILHLHPKSLLAKAVRMT